MTSPFKSLGGMTRLFNALRYSIDGLRAAYRYEAAFRQELALTSLLLVVAILLPVSWTQHALLIGSLLQVLLTELLNSGLEAIVDRVTVDHDDLAKRAKDMGSAAVLLSLLLATVIWAGVLLDRAA